jgi:hypothetical protein
MIVDQSMVARWGGAVAWEEALIRVSNELRAQLPVYSDTAAPPVHGNQKVEGLWLALWPDAWALRMPCLDALGGDQFAPCGCILTAGRQHADGARCLLRIDPGWQVMRVGSGTEHFQCFVIHPCMGDVQLQVEAFP